MHLLSLTLAGEPGFASSEGEAAGWQLMNEPMSVRPSEKPAPRLYLDHRLSGHHRGTCGLLLLQYFLVGF
jgi:hypothetical protein